MFWSRCCHVHMLRQAGGLRHLESCTNHQPANIFTSYQDLIGVFAARRDRHGAKNFKSSTLSNRHKGTLVRRTRDTDGASLAHTAFSSIIHSFRQFLPLRLACHIYNAHSAEDLTHSPSRSIPEIFTRSPLYFSSRMHRPALHLSHLRHTAPSSSPSQCL